MFEILGETPQPTKKRKTGWASMNAIQKSGLIACVALAIPSFAYSGRLGMFFGLSCWSSLFLGYVAGSRWRVRHAVHFWWSLLVAVAAHCGVLPVYARLINLLNASPHSGRGIIQLTGGLLAVEVIIFIVILKRAALWIHQRTHASAARVRV